MADFKLPDAAVDSIYHVLGALEAWGASYKYPADVCQNVFTYSENELQLLREPTNDVLRIYAGRLMRHKEITTLAMVLVQIHFMKLRHLQHIMAQRAPEQTTTANA